LVSFSASWYLLRILTDQYPQLSYLIYFILLFFPSIVFWSSGLMKETVGLASLYLLSGILLKWYWNKPILLIEYLLSALAIWVMLQLKFYVLGVFSIVAIYLFISRWVPYWHFKVILIFLLLLVSFFGFQWLHPWFRPERLPLTIFELHEQILEKSKESSKVGGFYLSPSYLSLALNSPIALITGLFRPFPWEMNSQFGLWLKIENLFIIGCSLFTLTRFKTIKWSELILITLLYISILAVFLSLSTPNFGSLARYRVYYLPFFLLLITFFPYHWMLRKAKRKL
jgi:hypothetical protein